MKKTTLGTVLLGAMVLAKAYIGFDTPTNNSIVSRNNSLQSTIEDALIVRGGMDTETTLQPLADLIATNFILPEFNASTDKTIQVLSTEILDQSSDVTINSNNESTIGEIEEKGLGYEAVPLDMATNTGYGLWKTKSEKITSKEDRRGLVPLDGENTINDNMSKLFPRTP